jgi:hypothetical protein
MRETASGRDSGVGLPRAEPRGIGNSIALAAVMVPCIVLALLSVWWTVAGLWPPDEVTLSEAVATRNNAEALRLIRLGANPNEASRVRGGLLTSDYDVAVTPVEAAVGAQRADLLRMLLANGATIDEREMRVLRCYEQVRRDAGVRDVLGEGPATDCAGVSLPGERAGR